MSQLTELEFARIRHELRGLIKARAPRSTITDHYNSQLPTKEDSAAYRKWSGAVRKKDREEHQAVSVSVPTHQEYRRELERTNFYDTDAVAVYV